MDIQKIDSGLTTTKKIELLNDFILQLNGLVESGKFDVNELNQIFSDMSELPRKFSRNVSLGHTLSDYGNWSHVHSESGYSVWKIQPSNFIHNLANRLYFDNKVVENRGAAQSENLSSFDAVFLYDGTLTAYTDNTTEAGTDAGTAFNLMDATNDYLYIGDANQFAGVSFEFEQRGSNYTLVLQYWNGSTWVTMTANDDALVDDTSGLLGDGRITWTNPSSWATTSVNGQTKYWVRISTTTTPITVAKAYLVVPADSVISLLQLSSEEFFAEEWAWCSYNGYIYVTIRNAGSPSYEGSFFITSASSTANKKSFFIYNHEYKIDYQNSSYTSTPPTYTFASGNSVIVGDLIYITSDDVFALATATNANKFAHGVCMNATPGSIAIKTTGRVKVNTVGAGNILAGDRVYLSVTSGKAIKSPDVSSYIIGQFIGIAARDESASQVEVLLAIDFNPPTIN